MQDPPVAYLRDMGHAGLSQDYRPHEDQAKLDPGGAVGRARRSHIPERDALSQYIVHVVSLVWVILRGANVIGTSSGHRISLSAGPNFFQTYSFELSHKCVFIPAAAIVARSCKKAAYSQHARQNIYCMLGARQKD